MLSGCSVVGLVLLVLVSSGAADGTAAGVAGLGSDGLEPEPEPEPELEPEEEETAEPTTEPTADQPTAQPTAGATAEPTADPTADPTAQPPPTTSSTLSKTAGFSSSTTATSLAPELAIVQTLVLELVGIELSGLSAEAQLELQAAVAEAVVAATGIAADAIDRVELRDRLVTAPAPDHRGRSRRAEAAVLATVVFKPHVSDEQASAAAATVTAKINSAGFTISFGAGAERREVAAASVVAGSATVPATPSGSGSGTGADGDPDPDDDPDDDSEIDSSGSSDNAATVAAVVAVLAVLAVTAVGAAFYAKKRARADVTASDSRQRRRRSSYLAAQISEEAGAGARRAKASLVSFSEHDELEVVDIDCGTAFSYDHSTKSIHGPWDGSAQPSGRREVQLDAGGHLRAKSVHRANAGYDGAAQATPAN